MRYALKPISLHDKAEIAAYLRRDTAMNLYALGDLDDEFFRYTTWYASYDDQGAINAYVLIYSGLNPPILLAMNRDIQALVTLLAATLPLLPRAIYGLLSRGVVETLESLAEYYVVESHGVHYRMLLTAPDRLQAIDTSAVTRLDQADLRALEKLLYDGNPGHWFDPWLLGTKQYFGIYRHADLGADLVAVAGIHTYAPAFGVAALGNIVTHPAWRGQGLAKQVTAALGQSLLEHIPTIGLNVRADNAAALRVYHQIGFSIEGEYEEFMLTAR